MKPGKTLRTIAFVILSSFALLPNLKASQSAWVYFDSPGHLNYQVWTNGNHIMDFSAAGYMGGGVAIPTNVATVVTVNPSGGDDTAAIQSAINTVAGHSLVNGFRGAVQLGAGTFNVSGQLNINSSGIVLRGTGSTNGTTIIMTNASSFTLFGVNGSGSASQSGTVSITDGFVPSGTNGFNVSSTAGFNVGDTVMVRRTVTSNWVHYLNMDTLVRSGVTQTWISVGTVILTDRKIAAVSGNKITLDVPLTDSFDTNYLGIPAGGLAHYSWSGRISNCALEHLRIVAPPVTSGYSAISMDTLMDSWVRDITIQDGVNNVSTGSHSKRVTFDSVVVTHTVVQTASAAPADFSCTGTQIFFNKCATYGTGSWPLVTHATSCGPVAVLNFYTTQDHGGITPHERWFTGILGDNVTAPNARSGGSEQGVAYGNRGTDGSGHGWTTGWSMGWNVIAPYVLADAAPGTENWAIGGTGAKGSSSDPHGIYDQLGSIVSPHSLYLEQLKERLGGAAVENIGYTLFTITNTPATRFVMPGTNTAFTINIGDPALMSNIVALAVDTLPANLGATLSTNTVTGSGSATLAVVASNAIVPGNYFFNVIGTSAGLSHTSQVSVVVGSYSLNATPGSQSILAGNTTNYLVTLATNNSFTGTVNLGISGLPAGAGASFTPSSLSGAGSSTLTITTTSNTPPGNYTLTISGTNGAAIVTTAVSLNVNIILPAAGTVLWTAAAGDLNWSTALNWTNVTAGNVSAPGISNDVKFIDLGSAVAVSNVNNIVNGNLAVSSLQYGNTNGNHTTLIGVGKTLTTGALTVGTETDSGNAQTVFTTITGSGGSLAVTNTTSNLVIRQASANSGSNLKAILDLSGLDNFTATVGRVQLGSFGANARPSGTLYLARTNLLIASGTFPAIEIGGQGGGSGNSGNGSFLYLGITNAVFANGISVGNVKQGGCFIQFNPAFLGANPVALFRAADGTNRLGTWNIADSQSQGGTVNTGGTCDFTGGYVDALVDIMTLGKSSSGSSGIGNPTGTLTFDGGTIDVNTLQIGFQNSGGPLTNIATGQLNVNGSALLKVNGGIELGHIPTGGTNLTKGTLNLGGGTVQATNIFVTGGTGIINVNSGTLDLGGGRITNVFALNLGTNGVATPAVLQNAASIMASNPIVIAPNGTLAGNTFITAPALTINGTVSPGLNGSVGTMTNNGTANFGAGGAFTVGIFDAGGTNLDFLKVNGALNIQAVSTNVFTVRLQSFDTNGPGEIAGFNDDTNYNWAIASASGGIANFSADKFTVDASAFQNDMAGGYFFVRTNGNFLVLSFTNNHPPAAGMTTVYRSGNVLAIPLSTIAATWSDPDGDPVALSSVDSSTNGASLGSDANFIYYTNANPVADTVFYTVKDVRTNPPAIYQPDDTQRIGTGQIIILPAPSMPVIGGVASSGSNLIVSGTNGPASGTYYVLMSTNVALPFSQWSPLMTNTFDGNGNFLFTNPAPVNGGQAFYLLKLP